MSIMDWIFWNNDQIFLYSKIASGQYTSDTASLANLLGRTPDPQIKDILIFIWNIAIKKIIHTFAVILVENKYLYLNFC